MGRAARGEIWQIDLGLAQKQRPALILSIDYRDEERALVTYIPRTTSVRGTRFEVAHAGPGFDPGAFDVQGIGTIPSVKLLHRRGMIDASTLSKVEEAARLWLML